jgi:NADPH2:quinone reductase
MTSMSAVASFDGLPIDDANSLQDVETAIPELRPWDVLVRVMAVSVNPADVKTRRSLSSSEQPIILGFDAAGVVEAVGPQVSSLSVGDEVWYAGDINRQGSNAEFQAIDERIVGRKPTTLSFSEAAAMPLTTITAWETLFDRFELTSQSQGTLLVLGAAGGVGSILIQLAKALTGLTVIGTASRGDSAEWSRMMGADVVINHHHLRTEALEAAPDGIDYLVSPHSAGNIDDYAAILRPFGHITAIDAPPSLDLLPLKEKCIAWHWEFMFARAQFETPDMIEQQRLLTRTAELMDDGVLRTTATKSIDDFSAAGLREAHREVESGCMIGKVTVHR